MGLLVVLFLVLNGGPEWGGAFSSKPYRRVIRMKRLCFLAVTLFTLLPLSVEAQITVDGLRRRPEIELQAYLAGFTVGMSVGAIYR
jgi:hypothetical protein